MSSQRDTDYSSAIEDILNSMRRRKLGRQAVYYAAQAQQGQNDAVGSRLGGGQFFHQAETVPDAGKIPPSKTPDNQHDGHPGIFRYSPNFGIDPGILLDKDVFKQKQRWGPRGAESRLKQDRVGTSSAGVGSLRTPRRAGNIAGYLPQSRDWSTTERDAEPVAWTYGSQERGG
jgi:hypothetical protein